MTLASQRAIYSPRSLNRLRHRLELVAQEEADIILKKVIKLFPAVKEITLRFADEPDTAMIEAELSPDAEILVRDKELILFVFNIHERAKEAPDYRARVRRLMIEELGDIVGVDFGGEED